ncbi:MAG: hypothetical protein ACHQ02_03270, partial [Candidatus Limnocylindrales bacterium]
MTRMSRRAAAAVALAALDLLVFAFAFIVVVWHTLSSSSQGPFAQSSLLNQIIWLALPIAFGTMAALLVTRVPGNAIGWLLLAVSTIFAASIVLELYVVLAADRLLPGAAAAVWLDNLLWSPAVALILAGVPLIFPTGRLLGPRWRLVVALLVVAIGFSFLGPMFTEGELSEMVPGLTNPLGLPGAQIWLDLSSLVAFVLFLPMVAVSFGAVVIRYRRGDSTERQQIKFLAAAAALAIGLFFASLVTTETPGTEDVIGDLSNLGLISIPIAIGIAILRYRLYDIDRIISRTLSWALVTGLLVACFAGLVIGLTSLLGSLAGGNTFAVAGSTLFVFALFQP